METIVIMMTVLVCVSFLLKQTFHGAREIMAMAVLLMVFVAMMWPQAIEQSKTAMAAWIADDRLMLDMAVLMSIDVSIMLFFCVKQVDRRTNGQTGRRSKRIHLFLKGYPGMLIFPVMFALLVWLIFLLPGVDFQWTAWMLGAALFLLVPTATYGIRFLLPEEEIRLELLFLIDILLALMGIIATVNGRTAVAGIDSVDFRSLLIVAGVVICGMVIGLIGRRIALKRIINKIEKEK